MSGIRAGLVRRLSLDEVTITAFGDHSSLIAPTLLLSPSKSRKLLVWRDFWLESETLGFAKRKAPRNSLLSSWIKSDRMYRLYFAKNLHTESDFC